MTNQSKKIFIAHDVLFAFIDRAHVKHDEAAAYIRYFAENEYLLFIDFVSLHALYNQIHADISTSLAKDFLRTISLSNINILYPDDSDWKATLKTIVASNSNELTFLKALVLVLSDKRRIPQVCTFEYLHPLFGINLFYLPL